MGKNKNRMFQSNLLDRAPVTEEGHTHSEATAEEPVAVETPNVPNEAPAPVAPAQEKKPDHGFYEETQPRVYGRVNSKCKKLNVREAADPEARVVSVLDSGKKVRILKDQSTDTFYKISLETGISGFAMKAFIDEV